MKIINAILIAFLFSSSLAFATTCAVYFTGIGCPHCAEADPFLLDEFTAGRQDFVVIEYELYQKQSNAPLFYNYNEIYGSGYGVPALVFGYEATLVGDSPIINGVAEAVASKQGNPCPFPSGPVNFDDLDLSTIPGEPVVWSNGRVFVGKPSDFVFSELLKELLVSNNVIESIYSSGVDYALVEPIPLALSGTEVNFDNAVEVGGVVFQWNGEQVNGVEGIAASTQSGESAQAIELTLPKILGLAAVDAVNPCAFAVLTLMLLAIITYNPKDKRNLLLAGLAFVASVFIMYLVYGLIIIKFFQLIQALTAVRLVLYKVLGLIAVVLGLLNLRDFFNYSPGGFATEMPLFMRGPLKNLIAGVTSPKGAFIVGAFVTVFLLPCTIGPYVIAGGILSTMELVKTMPWLLLYNAVFVLPMLVLIGIVYFGVSSVEDLSGWKDKNIKYMHLAAGTIIFLLGLAMLLGWV